MKRRRIVLYTVFAIYQICAFVFTIMVDGKLDLLGLLKYIPWFKYISFFGLVMLFLDVYWAWKERKDHKENVTTLEENEDLRTKLRDIEIARRLREEAGHP